MGQSKTKPTAVSTGLAKKHPSWTKISHHFDESYRAFWAKPGSNFDQLLAIGFGRFKAPGWGRQVGTLSWLALSERVTKPRLK